MRLKIELPANWVQQDNPEGNVIFWRKGSTGELRVSWAEKQGVSASAIAPEKLAESAVELGNTHPQTELVESKTGLGRFGSYGTAILRSPSHPRVQVWMITNGRDFILATHTCDEEPSTDEIAEVQGIAESLALGPD